MTRAACHTRQITAGGIEYRIDGGPAIVDFQSFLEDLDTAVGTVVNDSSAFAAFADAVLGPSPCPTSRRPCEAPSKPGTSASTPWSKGPCPTRPGASAAWTPCR